VLRGGEIDPATGQLDNKGAPFGRCDSCHGTANDATTGIPGRKRSEDRKNRMASGAGGNGLGDLARRSDDRSRALRSVDRQGPERKPKSAAAAGARNNRAARALGLGTSNPPDWRSENAPSRQHPRRVREHISAWIDAGSPCGCHRLSNRLQAQRSSARANGGNRLTLSTAWSNSASSRLNRGSNLIWRCYARR
jgi:hypothetical protein